MFCSRKQDRAAYDKSKFYCPTLLILLSRPFSTLLDRWDPGEEEERKGFCPIIKLLFDLEKRRRLLPFPLCRMGSENASTLFLFPANEIGVNFEKKADCFRQFYSFVEVFLLFLGEDLSCFPV